MRKNQRSRRPLTSKYPKYFEIKNSNIENSGNFEPSGNKFDTPVVVNFVPYKKYVKTINLLNFECYDIIRAFEYYQNIIKIFFY